MPVTERFIDTYEGIVLVEDDGHMRCATALEKEMRAEIARLRQALDKFVGGRVCDCTRVCGGWREAKAIAKEARDA